MMTLAGSLSKHQLFVYEFIINNHLNHSLKRPPTEINPYKVPGIVINVYEQPFCIFDCVCVCVCVCVRGGGGGERCENRSAGAEA